MSQVFLSSSWYRVAGLKPRLCDHAQLHRHRYRGKIWYVVQDHLSGRSHRLAPAAYLIVALMDGKRTVDQLWTEAATTFEAEAPSQDQVIQLLSQLHAADLLQADVNPDTTESVERYTKRKRSRVVQMVLNPLSIRLPLVDPNRFLERTLPILRPLFGTTGMLLWAIAVFPAIILAAMHWSALTENLTERVLSPSSLTILALVYPFTKILHELGHGYAARAFGSEVRESGVMFLVFYPVPYVDASRASGIRSKWKRVAVGAAGMLFETSLAAVALYAWLAAEPGTIRTVLFNVILSASVSTVVFNINPLLRFDGYYILSDLIEIPNLSQRANRFWGYLVERYAFALKDRMPPSCSAGERLWFLFYAPAAFLYRVAVSIAIALFVAGQFFFLGVAAAIWCLVGTLVIPSSKALKNVLTSPNLRHKRRAAIGVTSGSIGLLGLVLCLLPWPLWTTSEGVIWLPEQAYVRARASGFVTRLLVEPGTQVTEGQPLIAAEEPILELEKSTMLARIEELENRLGAERFRDRSQAGITVLELSQAQAELNSIEDRQVRLQATSPSSGTFVLAKATDLTGRYAREGEVMAYVVPVSANTIRVSVRQDDIDLVRTRLQRVRIMFADLLSETFASTILREVPAAQSDLPSPALGTTGGGQVAVDPRDSTGIKALQRNFQFDLKLPEVKPSAAFGARVHVRFEHKPEPLAHQAYRRVRQLFLSRFDV